ncbi:hypothetical protein HNQ40_000873 [Algisphaera agarilytica]|uniref:Uncharacterized protein n=1 Tax=Algisphaera agarilytica TaxID=1385975 RepID=A0A7X0H4V3_9BACT|nr:hypothetical protein [Algisphaera agarilytica]
MNSLLALNAGPKSHRKRILVLMALTFIALC